MAPRTYYEEPSGNVYTGRLSDMMSLFVGNLNQQGDTTINYRLRLWVDENYNPQNDNGGLTYKVKVNVYGQTSDTVAQAEDTYCKDNGFNTLSDCMLVMNNHEATTDVAKTNIKAKGTPDFSKIAPNDTETDGLYMAEDDEGESYYYRGAVKNNYVSFAGFIWRIIRRNGDGSVRMIYSGKKTNDSKETTGIGMSQFNDKYIDHTYMGYKYNENFSLHEDNKTTGYDSFNNTTKYTFGTGYIFDEKTKKFKLTGTQKELIWKNDHDEIVTNKLYSCLNQNCNIVYRVISYYSDTRMIVQPISYSSNSFLDTLSNNINSIIKSNLDNWYKFNLLNYEDYIDGSYFCNDRSINGGSGYLVFQNTHYGAYTRLFENSSPSLKCFQSSDKFNLNNKNARLDYPIALITADELSYAGAVTDTVNKDFYLYSGVEYYTMSPSYFDSFWTLAHMFTLDLNGGLEIRKNLSEIHLVRPVINLKSDITISSGDGTTDAPHKINWHSILTSANF